MKKTKEQSSAEKLQRNSLNHFAAKMLAKLELRGEKVVISAGRHAGIQNQFEANYGREKAKRNQFLTNYGPQGTLLGQKKDHDIWFYFQRLKGEINELQQAMKRHDIKSNELTCDAVISECCNVANFAAAIAEKAVEDTR